jgi:predicted RNase H-like nuclease (RuvC/YqgF family)
MKSAAHWKHKWQKAHDQLCAQDELLKRKGDTIRALRAEVERLTDSITTIADEGNGPHPVQSADDSLTEIERYIFDLRQRLSQSEREVERLKSEVAVLRTALEVETGS